MSLANFEKALSFLSAEPNERIGLIGGEPTIHPEFRAILQRLISSPFRSVCLFTNGIELEPFFCELRNKRFNMLINLNEPDKIGQANYEKIVRQIDTMVNHLYMREQVGIGLNFYRSDLDYSYVLDVLRRFQFKKLRISVAVPNLDRKRNTNALDYFRSMMPGVRALVKHLLELDVAPDFDCNYLPPCILKEEDHDLMRQYSSVFRRSNVVHTCAVCAPVLDILPDLQVIRCFAMSEFHKVRLSDFQSLDELKRHFLFEVDALAYQVLPDEACRDCRLYRSEKCSCGCYAYRLARMNTLRQFCDNLNTSPLEG